MRSWLLSTLVRNHVHHQVGPAWSRDSRQPICLLKCQSRQELRAGSFLDSAPPKRPLEAWRTQDSPSVHSGKDRSISGKHLEVFCSLAGQTLHPAPPTCRGEENTGPCAAGQSSLVMFCLECTLLLTCIPLHLCLNFLCVPFNLYLICIIILEYDYQLRLIVQ